MNDSQQWTGECENTPDQTSGRSRSHRSRSDIKYPDSDGWLTRHILRINHLVQTWRHRAKGRRQLTQMTEFQLKDIGISRIDAKQEANKPFWRP